MQNEYRKNRSNFDGPELWRKAKKGSGVILGGLLWWAGYMFSRGGFEAFLDLPKDHWLGFLMGIVVTWLQLNLNEGSYKHPTLFYSGLSSYIYGFFTNWFGLFLFQANFFGDNILATFISHPVEWVIRVV